MNLRSGAPGGGRTFDGIRRWTRRVGVVLAMVPLVLAGAVSQADDRPPILAGSEINYPPFCLVDAGGRPDGFSVELLRAALDAMGRDVAFRVGEWAEVKGWLEQGEVQALPLVGRTPEREALYDFTFPYMTLYGAIVVRADATGIERLEDLRGRRVAVMRADNAEEFLRREPRDIEIVTTATFEQAFVDLSEGRCEAVVVQRLVALRLLAGMRKHNLRVIPRPIDEFRQDFCFAVRKGDDRMLALLNEGLALAMADGTYRRLHAKWFAAMEIPSNRRLIFGGDHQFPPFEFLNEAGEPAGFTVDMTRAMAREAGMDVDIRLGPWANTVRALERGDIDAIQGMFYSMEREKKFDFSGPYLVSHYVSIVRDGVRPPASLKELTGLTLAVQEGDVIHDFLVEQGLDKRLLLVESQAEVLQAITQGRADCAIAIRVMVIQLIEAHGWTHLVLGRQPLFSLEYCFAVRKGDRALLARITEGLHALEKTGEYREIRQRWLGVEARSMGLRHLIRLLAWVAGPLLLLLLGITFWNRQLHRQVAARTRDVIARESQYRHLVENMQEILYTLNGEGVFSFVSPSWRRLLGHPEDAVIGQSFRPFVHPDDLAHCDDILREVLTTGERRERVEYRVRHADGTWRWHSSNVIPLKDETGAICGVEGIAEDITDRKEAELNYATLFEKMLNGFAVHEMIFDEEDRPKDYRFLAVNPAFEHMTGLRASQVVGKTVLDVLPSTERKWIERYGAVTRTGAPTHFENYSAELNKCFEVTAFRAAPNRFACIFSDITERRRAQARVEHLNRVLLAIRDVNQLIVREHAPETLIREGCRLLVEHRGYLSALILRTHEADRIVDWAGSGSIEFSGAVRVLLDQGGLPQCCAEAKETKAMVAITEPATHCKDCSLLTAHATTAVLCVRLFHENVVYGYLLVTLDPTMDMSDEERQLLEEMAGDLAYALHNLEVDAQRKTAEAQRERLSEQLLQAQKMDSIGRLAGGVAHDFNNLLMGILGYVELAQEEVGARQPLREFLDEVKKNAERSADLTRQLLAFARRQTIVPKVFDLNDAVAGMLGLLRRLLGEEIDLAWMPGLDVGLVTMDPSQLDQLLANLCANARDAIEGVGKLTIETQACTIDAAYCRLHAEADPGAYVMLAVSDTGCGIPPEVQAHLFEPFFTTKKQGAGTGLGLSTVYGIVKQNKGFINVYSEAGRGTTFKIYLPRTAGAIPSVAAAAVTEVPRGTETILLVEDDDAIRRVTTRYLTSLGYTVLSAGTPEDALRIVAAHEGEIPLLITDVVMPGMSGRDLSNRLLELRPRIKTLFMSGYTADVIAHQGVLDAGVEFLQKPVPMADLGVKVREMLG
jgi:PAS domain S-box-containing protein